MKFKIDWQQNGSTIVDARDEEEAKDQLTELIKGMDMPGFYSRETEWQEPMLLSCDVVDWVI